MHFRDRPRLRSRIGHAPMGGHRLPRPYRARFGRGVVAERKGEIKLGYVRAGEFGPTFGAKSAHVVVQPFEDIDRIGVNVPLGMAAGREGTKPSLSRAVEH